MTRPLLVTCLTLTLFLATCQLAECFSILARASLPRSRQAPSSTTVLCQTKKATFRSSNGTLIHKSFSSNKSLKEFYEDLDVVILIDEATNQSSLRPDFRTLIKGANYTFLTAMESLLPAVNRVRDGAVYTLGGPVTGPADQTTVQQQEFDYDLLPTPSTIRPLIPTRFNYPGKYICPSGYRQSVLDKIYNEMAASDSGVRRVPPMALVGCSRSGKTATLEEFALALADSQNDTGRAIFITFNEYSLLASWEKNNPLQAVLTRLVFALLKSGTNGTAATYRDEFIAFRRKRFAIDPWRIQSWLADTPVVLMIDELNNLMPVANTTDASDLGDFLRDCFLSQPGQYLVFTSHVLGALPLFGDIIDSSSASSRTVAIQRLPRVESLLDVVEYLNPDISGATEAMYYGLLPGMIYDRKLEQNKNLKQKSAMATFNARSFAEKEDGLVNICASFITGDIDQVPLELHILLTVRPLDPGELNNEVDDAYIGWVPFIFQYVLRRTILRRGHWLAAAKNQLSWMCERLGDAAQGSGKRYEFLFAICYAARCIAQLSYGDMLPSHWVDRPKVAVKINPFDPISAGKAFDMCKTWSEMKKGIAVPSPRRTIALFIPGNDKFESYDIIAALIEGNVVVDSRGFQLKEAAHSQRKPKDLDAIEPRFLCKGFPPPQTLVDQQGWIVPQGSELAAFFGESGRYWTPEQWRRLNDSFEEALRLRKVSEM